MEYLFSLDNSRPTKVFYCPDCGKKTFKRYWNNEENEYFIDSDVGRCNREIKCGYHYTPKQYFEDNKDNIHDFPVFTPKKIRPTKVETPLITYIQKSSVERAFRRDLPNYFIDYLKRLFKDDLTSYLVEKFKISPSTHWKGSTIFWQIDENENVRAGKVILFNVQTGKRVKVPFSHINWVHSIAKYQDFHLKQCFFGLNHVKDDLDKTIGIVESEKTAILMTAIYPKLIWIASGGINLPIDNFEPLEGRKIVLFPDVGDDKDGGTPFEKWREKADTLTLMGFDIVVSNIIENVVTEEQRAKGYDLADYLIKTDSSGLALTEDEGYPIFWDFKQTFN